MSESVVVDRSDLNDAIKLLVKLVRGNVAPILQNLRMAVHNNMLELITTDRATRLVLKIPCSGPDVNAILVPIKVLQKLVKGKVSNDHTVRLQVTNVGIDAATTTVQKWDSSDKKWINVEEQIETYTGELSIDVDGVAAKIKLVMDPSDFPELVIDGKKSKIVCTTTSGVWKEPLGYVRQAISVDTGRRNLECVFVDDEIMVATDGHRLHGVRKNFGILSSADGLLINNLSVQLLLDLISDKKRDVVFSIHRFDDFVVFDSPMVERGKWSWKIVCRFPDGKFPDYKQVIPDVNKSFGSFVFEKEKFLRVLARMKNLSDDDGCIFVLEDTGLKFGVTGDGNEISADLEVENINRNIGKYVNRTNGAVMEANKFKMSMDYVKKAVQFAGADKIRFSMESIDLPGVFKPVEGGECAGYFGIVMPRLF